MNINLSVDKPQVYELDVSKPNAVNIGVDMMVRVDAPPYTGETTVTPTNEQQELQTVGKLMKKNVIIEPIPSNYGLITWNGSVLTVS